jgi:hypothetical protein
VRAAAALGAAYLRQALRASEARALALGALGLLVATVLLPTRAAGTVGLGALVLVAVICFAAAAAAGGLLPADRAEGRAAWLATLAPPRAAARLGAVLAGGLVALAVALLGALALGALSLTRGGLELREAVPVAVPAGARLSPGGAEVALALLPLPRGGTLEILAAPRYRSPEDVRRPLRLAWRAGASGGESVAPYGSTLRAALPAGVEGVVLAPAGPTPLVLVSARVLGDARPLLPTFLVLALLLGVAAAAVVPWSVALSRVTSTATAVAGPLVLALASLLRPALGDLVPPDASLGQRAALAVVSFAGGLGPDLGALGLLREPAEGRALAAGDLAALLPLLPHALVGLLLALVPGRPQPLAETP